MDSKIVQSKHRILNTMEHQRFLNFEEPSPRVILSSIIKKPYFNSTINNIQSKHTFVRIDNELRNIQGMEILKSNLADEIQRETYLEFSDCLSVKEGLLKRELISIFIIPPRLLFALKQKLRYYSRNVSVVIVCRDEFDVQHQLNNLYLQKITKLITCDPAQILYFIKEKIQSSYSSIFNSNLDECIYKFHYSKGRNSVINLYYPYKFQHFTKVFQTGAAKRRINYPNLHFYCYNNKKDIILKDRTKVKTKRFITRDKISTQNQIQNIDSRVSISTIATQMQTNIIVTTRQNEDHMIQYIEDRTGYDIVALSNEDQKIKFLKQFEQVFSSIVYEIEIIASEKLNIFIQYSDKQLINFLQEISKNIQLEIIQYSSLSGLSQQVYKSSQYQQQFGLIICPLDNEQMMEMMLTMKDVKNIKLIVYSFTKSHLTKTDSVYVFKKTTQREALFQLLKQLIDNRRQYFRPIETIKQRKIILLVDKRYTQLCQQIIIIVDSNPYVGLQIYQKQQDVYELLNSTSSQINYLLICKEQRRAIIMEYIRLYQNIKLVLLSQMSDIEYHPIILQVLTRHSDLLEFISRLCREKKQTDDNLKIQFEAEQLITQQQIKFSFESLVIVPIKQKQKSKCIMIYCPNRDYCEDWLVLERRLKNLDQRVDIFHYNRVIDITKINLNQQPLSIVLVTHPNIQWAANYSHEFQTGINIVAYSKSQLSKDIFVESINLVATKLQEIEQFILQAIRYYDQNKLSMIIDNQIIEATKLSLQSSMKKSVERRTKKISAKIPTQYYPKQLLFPSDALLPPKMPSSKKNKSDSQYSDKNEKNIKSQKTQQKKIPSNMKSNSKKQSVAFDRVSLSELGMDSTLSKINPRQASESSHERIPTQTHSNMVYILQHKLINQPTINNQNVTTMIYQNFNQLQQIQRQLLSNKNCKIILKLITQSQSEHIPNHSQLTIIKYPTPKKQSVQKGVIRQNKYRDSKKHKQSRIQAKSLIQRQQKQSKLRTQSMSKEKKISTFNSQLDDLIVKKNFFAKMFEKQLVYFFVLQEQRQVIKLLKSQKSINPRIRLKRFQNPNNMYEQLIFISEENTYITIISDEQILFYLNKNPDFKSLKVIFFGQQKLPDSVSHNSNYLSIKSVNILDKLVSCIPRFYKIDKLSKQEVNKYEIIHFYLDDGLPEIFLLNLLSVSKSNQKCIPHKFSSVQQLKYMEYHSNELIILIIGMKKFHNQSIQKLSKKQNIKTFFIQKQYDQITRLLLFINGKGFQKINIESKNIQSQLFSLEYNRTVKQQQNSEISYNNQPSTITSKDSPYLSQKRRRSKQTYIQQLQEIDQTAYMFENRQILQNISSTNVGKKLYIVIPQINYKQLFQILNHMTTFYFLTYSNTKSLIQTLRYKERNVVLLNSTVTNYKQIMAKFPHHIYLTFQQMIGVYFVQDNIKFGILLELSIKFREKKSKIKPKKNTIEKISIFYKYPKDYTLKAILQKISSKIKCVAYESVKGLLSQLNCLNIKNSLNIIIERDQDIFQIQHKINSTQFKLIRMLTLQFQQQNILQINQNILIEATKSSSVIACIKNIVGKLFGDEVQETIRKESKRTKL